MLPTSSFYYFALPCLLFSHSVEWSISILSPSLLLIHVELDARIAFPFLLLSGMCAVSSTSEDWQVCGAEMMVVHFLENFISFVRYEQITAFFFLIYNKPFGNIQLCCLLTQQTFLYGCNLLYQIGLILS